MISIYDMRNYIEKQNENLRFYLDSNSDYLYSKDLGEKVCTLKEFTESYRKLSGESFESIFYEHVGLFNVLKCTECGTVIFTYEDESYDPSLKCPVCTDYKTHFEYWTIEDIQNDVCKQGKLKWFDEATKQQIEKDDRIKRRKGKYDWQIIEKRFYGKMYCLSFELECNDITKSYFKGLRLKLSCGKKDNADSLGYKMKLPLRIPLCWSKFYIQFIYKHLGKCHPDLRSKWFIGKARK